MREGVIEGNESDILGVFWVETHDKIPIGLPVRPHRRNVGVQAPQVRVVGVTADPGEIVGDGLPAHACLRGHQKERNREMFGFQDVLGIIPTHSEVFVRARACVRVCVHVLRGPRMYVPCALMRIPGRYTETVSRQTRACVWGIKSG